MPGAAVSPPYYVHGPPRWAAPLMRGWRAPAGVGVARARGRAARRMVERRGGRCIANGMN